MLGSEEKPQFHFDRNVSLRMDFVAIGGGGEVRGKERSPLNYATAFDSAT